MDITDFTTYEEVRAALGVSSEELEDTTLALDLYGLNLSVELSEIGATLAAEFLALTAPTAGAEQNFVDAVKLFAPYAIARQVLPALPLLAPKSITDGKASITRDSSAPFKETALRVQTDYERFKKWLADRYSDFKGASAPATPVRPFMAVVTPATDPVTG
jgi:hypothetical protein